jgi:hypothetical protein
LSSVRGEARVGYTRCILFWKSAAARKTVRGIGWRRKNKMFPRKCLFFISWLTFCLTPAVSAAQISWAKSFDAALKQAAAEKKCIVLDFSTST